MSARRGQGIAELLQMVHGVATGEIKPRPHRLASTRDSVLDRAVSYLVTRIEAAFPGLPNARWVALRLLDGDASIESAIGDGSLGDLSRGLQTAPVAERLALVEATS